VLASVGVTFGGIIGFIVWVLVMVWIYNIAKRKGRHAVAWVILGFFFSLITLIVILLMPSKRTTANA
jgi:inner membrane protein involved in colicin E2 resistance